MNHFSRAIITAACLLLAAGSGNAQNPKQPDDSARVVARLILDLSAENSQTRAAARYALRPDGPYAKTALPALIDALNDPDFAERWSLTLTLADYGPKAVPSLLEALKRPNADIRAVAAGALGRVRPCPVEAVPALIAAMRDPAPEVRMSAARQLGEMRRAADKAIPALILGLGDTDLDVRVESAVALGEFGPKAVPAVGPLAKALKDPDFFMRLMAADALRMIGPAAKAAVPALITTVRDINAGEIRRRAAWALGDMGPAAKEAVPCLLSVLKAKERDFTPVMALAGTLAMPQLIAKLKEDDDDLRAVAVNALVAIGPDATPAVPQLLAMAKNKNDKHRGSALWALGRIGPAAKEVIPQLLAIAKDKNDKHRDEALWALGAIGPAAKEAVPLLIEELSAREPLFRPCEVAEALAGIGPEAKAAVPTLAALARNRQELYNQVREYAAKAVMKIDPAFAAREGMEFAYLNIRLGKVQAVRLKPRPPVTDEQAKRIKALIADLAKIDKPDFGLSGTLTGTAFAPLPGSGKIQGGLITDHQLGTSAAFRSLVELGPTALPFLLDALGDKTPTGLKVRRFAGVLAVGGSMPDGNPFNAKEKKAAAMEPAPAANDDDDDDTGFLESYTVTVGDVCYVAIGQIVGRQYLAVRYIPSGNIGVSSPTASPLLRDQLRAAWGGPDPAKVLLDSLLTDYTTEGLFNGNSLDGWGEGSDFQVGAVTRLLYYFPEETAPLVAARLRALDVMVPKVKDGRMLRDVKNRVRTIEFIEAVSWCKAAPIRVALADIAERTDDPHIKKALAAGNK